MNSNTKIQKSRIFKFILVLTIVVFPLFTYAKTISKDVAETIAIRAYILISGFEKSKLEIQDIVPPQ